MRISRWAGIVVAFAGTAVSAGCGSAEIDLGGRFHRSRIRLISSQVSTLTPELLARWSKARRLEVAWTMLGRVPVCDLITHTFPIAEAAQAYALLDHHPEQAVQVIFTYE